MWTVLMVLVPFAFPALCMFVGWRNQVAERKATGTVRPTPNKFDEGAWGP